MARRAASFWICKRVAKGEKCLHRNPARTRKCGECGKDRPRKSPPKHMAGLNQSYEHYIEINGGEHCGICGKGPDITRKLDRDHEHTAMGLGVPRGLLCRGCNMRLSYQLTREWLIAAVSYLDRHEERLAAVLDEEVAA